MAVSNPRPLFTCGRVRKQILTKQFFELPPPFRVGRSCSSSALSASAGTFLLCGECDRLRQPLMFQCHFFKASVCSPGPDRPCVADALERRSGRIPGPRPSSGIRVRHRASGLRALPLLGPFCLLALASALDSGCVNGSRVGADPPDWLR
jgi:hypothetical protein